MAAGKGTRVRERDCGVTKDRLPWEQIPLLKRGWKETQQARPIPATARFTRQLRSCRAESRQRVDVRLIASVSGRLCPRREVDGRSVMHSDLAVACLASSVFWCVSIVCEASREAAWCM